jgi:hypothetical protein
MLRLARAAISAALLLLGAGLAQAQSPCVYIVTGAVLTAAQWNLCFQNKQDGLGFSPVNKAGDTITGKLFIASPSPTAFSVGPNGVLNPAFNIDASAVSAATGLNIQSLIAGSGLNISVISTGTNENLKIDAKGSGSVKVGTNSTGGFGFNVGSDSTNDMYYRASSGLLARITQAAGSNYVLTQSTGVAPAFTPPTSGSVVSVTCGGVTITTTGTCPPAFGFQNCSLAPSVASNLLTVALKDNAGSNPSATSPCNLYFRNATPATGSWSQVNVTGALSISTFATGATLGSVNNTAFRFWVVAFNNGGTAVLALINCSTSAGVFPLNPGVVASSTAMTAGATSAGVFYTPNGTTVSNAAFIVLGYVEYNATGLATAGTYASAPNFTQTMGTGIRMPGASVQKVYASSSTSSTNATGTPSSTNLTANITPSSAANLVQYSATYAVGSGAASLNCGSQMFRGATSLGSNTILGTSAAVTSQQTVVGLDLPNATSAQTYVIKGAVLSGSGTCTYLGGNVGTEILEEIMG